LVDAGLVSVEMESDTLFVLGAYRGWRTGALYASDGTPTEIKPEWGEESFRKGVENAIQVALDGMYALACADGAV
jgi:uridine phosphorylase